MTPEEALGAAVWPEDWNNGYTSQATEDAVRIKARLYKRGYSLVPTADLDRLRAVERAAQNVTDRRTLSDDGYWVSQKEMNALDAALGDRAAEGPAYKGCPCKHCAFVISRAAEEGR